MQYTTSAQTAQMRQNAFRILPTILLHKLCSITHRSRGIKPKKTNEVHEASGKSHIAQTRVKHFTLCYNYLSEKLRAESNSTATFSALTSARVSQEKQHLSLDCAHSQYLLTFVVAMAMKMSKGTRGGATLNLPDVSKIGHRGVIIFDFKCCFQI